MTLLVAVADGISKVYVTVRSIHDCEVPADDAHSY